MKTTSPVVVPINQETSEILKRILECGHGTPPNGVIVCLITPMNSRNVLAFLVIALNRRRPFDEDYRGFIHLLTQQVTTPQLSAVILSEEVERRQQPHEKKLSTVTGYTKNFQRASRSSRGSQRELQ